MSSKKVLAIFGATGNQGGSVINTLATDAGLDAKYTIRCITRNIDSAKSRALASRGFELARADTNDADSIRVAIRGAYGVFAMTDYWSLLDKEKEIQQGKSIVDACRESGVRHLVWSALPHVSKLSHGRYTGVAHFDSKAEVAEYAEATKGDMVVSYFMPAMFMDVVKQITQKDDDSNWSISLPYPDPNIPWPLLSPSRDTGKYVLGLFEGGASANGIHVQGTSEWVTPIVVVETLARQTGKKAVFNSIKAQEYEAELPEQVRGDMSDMMQWIGESSYYGKGTEKSQTDSNKWLIKGAQLTSWAQFVQLEF